jgi:hypothetical protein
VATAVVFFFSIQSCCRCRLLFFAAKKEKKEGADSHLFCYATRKKEKGDGSKAAVAFLVALQRIATK